MESLISVIVPVYNVEAYLNRCLQSIVDQTYDNLDIILVDDGSSDKCPSICDMWGEKDQRIRVLHKENGGVSSARNAGLKVAQGDWVSFVDSDDWIHPRFFEVLMMLATKSTANIIAANHWRTEESKLPNAISLEQLEYRHISGESIFKHWDSRFFVWGKLYARDIISGHVFDENVPYGEDALFNIEVLGRANICIIYTSERLYYYYVRHGSAVSKNRQKNRVELCKVYLRYADYERNAFIKRIYLESAIKRALSTRYDARVFSELEEIINECNACLNIALQSRSSWKGALRSKYFIYKVFYRFPFVYRLWRIKNDPTLLEWEKKYRSEKKIQSATGKAFKDYSDEE